MCASTEDTTSKYNNDITEIKCLTPSVVNINKKCLINITSYVYCHLRTLLQPNFLSCLHCLTNVFHYRTTGRFFLWSSLCKAANPKHTITFNKVLAWLPLENHLSRGILDSDHGRSQHVCHLLVLNPNLIQHEESIFLCGSKVCFSLVVSNSFKKKI